MMWSLFFLVISVAAGSVLPWSNRHQQHQLATTGLDRPTNNGQHFTRTEIFAFDIHPNNYYDHLTIGENVDADLFPAGLNGVIRMEAGSRNQARAFLVLVRIVASSEVSFSAIDISHTDYELHVNTRTGHGVPHDDDHATLDIVLFIRPNAFQMRGTTTLISNTLDIHVSPGIWYETYHMNLHSRSGNIYGTDVLNFVPHALSVKTGGKGAILGRWPLPSAISFSTTLGPIDIILTPKRWSSGPDTAGDLDARSGLGNITINMSFDSDKLSLRNATTRIKAEYGSVSGQLVHGALTDIRAGSGIEVVLLPYWAFYDWSGVQHNVIETVSDRGTTNLGVLPPVIIDYYGTNPLWFAVSRHRQGKEGKGMKLSYPGEWAGNAEGRGEQAEISGEEFERLKGNKTLVRARRRPAGSELVFESGGKPAVLELEPCLGRNEFCPWQKGKSEEL